MSILSMRTNYHKVDKFKKCLTIYVGNTYIAAKCSRYGILETGIDISRFIKNNLTEFTYDHRRKRYVAVYQYSRYQAKTGVVHMPRYALEGLLTFLGPNAQYRLVNMDVVEPKIVDMSLKLNIEAREHQKPILEFLETDEAFKPIGVFTGGGKSFMAVAGIVIKKHPAVIVLPSLIMQWYKTIQDFTDIDKGDVYVVQGFDKLRTLIALVKEGYIPKIVIFSTRTLVMYCSTPKMPYSEVLPFDELMCMIGVGTKVIDEVHMNFNANVLVDIQVNLKYNIYLSATYQRSNDAAKKIFNRVFPIEMIYGDAIGKKYTEVYLASYSLPITEYLSDCITEQGYYNHALYERILMMKGEFFMEFVKLNLIPLINSYYVSKKRDGQKLLVLCATKAMANAICDYLTTNVNFTVTTFFSGSSGISGDENVFVEYDCVVSTHKSCGTGRDIKNLKTCINTLSFSSAPLANQVMGRLRELPDEITYFVDMYNREVPSHERHIADRTITYQLKAKSITNITTT